MISCHSGEFSRRISFSMSSSTISIGDAFLSITLPIYTPHVHREEIEHHMEIARHLHRQIALVAFQIQLEQLHEPSSELKTEQRRLRLVLPQMPTPHKHVPLIPQFPAESAPTTERPA